MDVELCAPVAVSPLDAYRGRGIHIPRKRVYNTIESREADAPKIIVLVIPFSE